MRYVPYKKIIAVVMALCVCSSNTVFAKTTQESIKDTKEQISDLKEQKEEAQEQVDDISDKKEDLESDLGELNGELSKIVSSMNELEEQIRVKEDEIDTAQARLTEAEAACQQQYYDMKLRIQYMYENGNVTTWQMLLESKSIADFLNRTEYIAEINQYDRDMLVQFQELQADIAQQKTELETHHEQLLGMKEDMEAQQTQVNTLITATKGDIAKTDDELAKAQENVDELEQEIARMVEYEKQLEIQKAKEDAARLAAIKEQEKEDTSGVTYVQADSDVYLLGAIIQCESGGESYEGKLAVGSVIMNRVKSSYFPNTVSGVIYQGGQFSPVTSGRLAYRLQAGVDSSCLQAAQEVLNGNITLNCLYFRANNGIIQGIVIGNHVFY